MRASRFLPTVFLALAAAPAAARSPADPPSGAEVVVGLLLPADPVLARSLERGAAVGAGRASDDRRTVRVAARAAPGPWGSEAAVAVRLVYEDGAAGIVAPPDRPVSHLAAQIAAKAHAAVVVLSGAGSLTRIPLPWLARAVPEDRRVLADLLAAVPGPGRERTLAILAGEGREEGLLRETAAAVAREGGVRVLPPALAGKADAVLVGLSAASGGRALRDLRAAGWRGTALAAPGADGSALAAAAGEAAEGLVAARLFDGSLPGEPSRFRADYRERFGEEPDGAAAAAYDAVLLLARAARAGGGSREGTRGALLDGGALEGATGRILLDGAGNRRGGARLRRLRDGKWTGPEETSEERR